MRILISSLILLSFQATAAFGRGGSSTMGPGHPMVAGCAQHGGRLVATAEDVETAQTSPQGALCLFEAEGSAIDAFTLYLQDVGQDSKIVDAFLSADRAGLDPAGFCESLGGHVKTLFYMVGKRVASLQVCDGMPASRPKFFPGDVDVPLASDYDPDRERPAPPALSDEELAAVTFHGFIGLNTLFAGAKQSPALAKALQTP